MLQGGEAKTAARVTVKATAPTIEEVLANIRAKRNAKHLSSDVDESNGGSGRRALRCSSQCDDLLMISNAKTDAELAAKDAKLAEKDAALAAINVHMALELAQKDAEIEALRRRLSACEQAGC